MEVVNKDEVLVNKNKYIKKINHSKPKKTQKNNVTLDASIAPKLKIQPYVITLFLTLLGLASTLFALIASSKTVINFILPAFFPPLDVICIASILLYTCITIGLFFVINQSVNKKVYLLYLFNSIVNILLILSLFFLQNIGIAMMLSIVIFYLAFTLFNELKKVNKIALYTFLPYCIWCIFVITIIYFVLMMN